MTGTYKKTKILRQNKQAEITYRQTILEKWHLDNLEESTGCDEVEIQVAGNYGNLIYTNKAGADMIYRDAEITKKQATLGYMSMGLDTFELINLIVKKLNAAGYPAEVF